ncbi:MAG: ImmA/IrrE family metallo-endopeptidase [Candidatus Accumulibacter sp.]|jgi:Zn-dependent peptidase ImmA (M78 family)|nr:ImmA/IrrE family metallo-endopeptidase [Accumulibacter sp.]
MTTVAASIPVLRWAAQRARLHDENLTEHYQKWLLWLSGEAQPTLRQLEDFARRTHTAIGYFFLPEPPALTLPVPDFRTLCDETLAEPSSDLLDTLYLCQQRQDWYRDYAHLHGLPALAFVGSARMQDTPEAVAQRMREVLDLSAEARRKLPNWTEALRQLIAKSEDAGVMVMASSVVGSNSHRKLDMGEFRGFVLADDLAPLVFLNGADSKAAQMFTLAHELAHLWLGTTGVSDTQAGQVPEQQTERWCNQVAAELLIPLQAMRAVHQPDLPIPDEIQRLAREFKVSTLVALRRLFDAGFIDQTTLWQYYRGEQTRLRHLERRSRGGGDFYRSLGARASKRFARAVVSSTLEGQTLFQDAFRMLGVRKTTTFYETARELGVIT